MPTLGSSRVKRLSEVAAATSWDTVHRAVCMAVDWGLAHRDLGQLEAIGVDDSRRRGQRYLTLVYRSTAASVCCGSDANEAATLEGFFDWFGAATQRGLYFVCSDEVPRWSPPRRAGGGSTASTS